MKKLIGFALAGALFAVAGCGPSTAEKKETTPAANKAPAADASAASADGGAAPAPATTP